MHTVILYVLSYPLTHTLNTHVFMHIMAARIRLWHCMFYSMLSIPTQSFTKLYKHAVQIDARTNTHTVPLELSRTRTPAHSQPYTTKCQYRGQAFLETLLAHSPLAVLANRR